MSLLSTLQNVDCATPCLKCGRHLEWNRHAHHVEGDDLILACPDCRTGTAVGVPRHLPQDATLYYDSCLLKGREPSPAIAVLFWGQLRREILGRSSLGVPE